MTNGPGVVVVDDGSIVEVLLWLNRSKAMAGCTGDYSASASTNDASELTWPV